MAQGEERQQSNITCLPAGIGVAILAASGGRGVVAPDGRKRFRRSQRMLLRASPRAD